jgi:hypothetical protein
MVTYGHNMKKKSLTQMRAEKCMKRGFTTLALSSCIVNLDDLVKGKLLSDCRRPKACVSDSKPSQRVSQRDFEATMTRENYESIVYGSETGNLFGGLE